MKNFCLALILVAAAHAYAAPVQLIILAHSAESAKLLRSGICQRQADKLAEWMAPLPRPVSRWKFAIACSDQEFDMLVAAAHVPMDPTSLRFAFTAQGAHLVVFRGPYLLGQLPQRYYDSFGMPAGSYGDLSSMAIHPEHTVAHELGHVCLGRQKTNTERNADKLADKWLAGDFDSAMCSRDWTGFLQTVSLR